LVVLLCCYMVKNLFSLIPLLFLDMVFGLFAVLGLIIGCFVAAFASEFWTSWLLNLFRTCFKVKVFLFIAIYILGAYNLYGLTWGGMLGKILFYLLYSFIKSVLCCISVYRVQLGCSFLLLFCIFAQNMNIHRHTKWVWSRLPLSIKLKFQKVKLGLVCLHS